MLFRTKSPLEKRQELREKLNSGRLLQLPGAISPLTAMQIETMGFDGVYISGSVLSNDLGFPDIGLTTLTEVTQRGRQISRSVNLPCIIDADTGFGEPLNMARTIQEMIELGLCGCHIEDQINPKRCGHLDGKSLISTGDMVKKIRAAHLAKKTDPHFLIIARTDARAGEGLDKAIQRAQAYVDGGADAIFPEALESLKEFEIFRSAIKVPLLANMTEFGKGSLWTYEQLSSVGFNMVIYPVTLLRLAMKATEMGLKTIKEYGSQEKALSHMQTRQELYQLTQYEQYNQLDHSLFDFQIPNSK
jgi:methylisocitrate lyase